ncbi:FkbM family methyltransferase [Antarcticibacterium sp. 1MA-6-2]|uniref:FkbM family methyltransferase n=1 Tax=Antarcticibacterium sp. 1MA-6-2 TaxID=2908210 RepID=UPI001EFFF316|nr:FkbM family methyltransferase [Antarcticibacterium sp. 1MA-6-2]UJH92526.1 FkbM family methyltransferase [Antarcticibacterium sp. 1MA-6-2]
MSITRKALHREIRRSLRNNYGAENFDEYRFGKYPFSKTERKQNFFISKNGLKRTIKNLFGLNNKKYKVKLDRLIKGYLPQIDQNLKNLSTRDQILYKSLVIYRLLGFKKVKLPRNNSDYWSAIETAKSLVDNNDTIDPEFLHFVLKKCDLKPIGYNVQFYFTEKGIAVDYILEQYAYKVGKEVIVGAQEGDTVLDLGACWGDTALYFADKVGKKGKVYSFEFIPSSIQIFRQNLEHNPQFRGIVELIEHPAADKSDEKYFYVENGPGSRVSSQPLPGHTGSLTSISIDDLVEQRKIPKVDFIKMDIEGAELLALEGAIVTIKKFRPKLAIAIYHSLEDFVNIPQWILNLDLGYKIYIDHYSIHAEETVCFALPRNDIK